MKTYKLTIAILIIFYFTSACSKDEPNAPVEVFPEQNPLPSYLAFTGFNLAIPMNGSYAEFGYSFIPLVNGKITAIVVKTPNPNAAMRITFWDKSTGTPVRTQILNIPTAGVELIQPISALDVVKDKEYLISLNSNDWYVHKKSSGLAASYPFIIGDIKITGYSYKFGTAQEMPNTPSNFFYEGDCSFKFQKIM